MLTKSVFPIFILEAAPRRATYPRVWPPAEVPYRHAPAHPLCSLQLLQVAPSRFPDSPRSTSSSRATVPSSCNLDSFSIFHLYYPSLQYPVPRRVHFERRNSGTDSTHHFHFHVPHDIRLIPCGLSRPAWRPMITKTTTCPDRHPLSR